LRITGAERLGEGGCPASLEGPITLEEGQVWELNVGDALEPSVLLELYRGKMAGLDQDYWRCLSLESGRLFSATVRRWDPTYFGHSVREHDDDDDYVPLVGRRLL